MRIIRFLRELPRSIRITGGVFNPFLRHTIRATWLRTGPQPPSSRSVLDISDEEWDAWMEAMGIETKGKESTYG